MIQVKTAAVTAALITAGLDEYVINNKLPERNIIFFSWDIDKGNELKLAFHLMWEPHGFLLEWRGGDRTERKLLEMMTLMRGNGVRDEDGSARGDKKDERLEAQEGLKDERK